MMMEGIQSVFWRRGSIASCLVLAVLLNSNNHANARQLQRESNDFQCQEEGFHADPNNCNIYYRCVNWGNNSPLTKFKFECGPGTVFSESSGNICVHPRESERSQCSESANDLDSSVYYQQTNRQTTPPTSWSYGSPSPSTPSTNGYFESTTSNFDRGSTENSRPPSNSYPPANHPSPDYSQSSNQPSGDGCTKEGFIPDPQDCRKFIRCVSNGNSYQRYEFTCGEGTLWDTSVNGCNHAWAVRRQGCSGSSQNEGSSTYDGDNNRGNGYGESENGQNGYPGNGENPQNVNQGSDGNDENGNSQPTDQEESNELPRPPGEDYPPSGGLYPPSQTPQTPSVTEGNEPSQTGSDNSLPPPSYPSQPSGPSQGSNSPSQPSYPSGPSERPVGSSSPSQPSYPSGPSKPSGGSNFPSQPSYPSGPSGGSDSPSQPSYPSEPSEQPGGSSSPSQPSYPSGPPKPTGDSNSPSQPAGTPGKCSKEGFFPDPSNCRKFYRCVQGEGSSLTKYEFTCGEGTAWDQSILTCNYDYAVPNCRGESGPDDSSTNTGSSTSTTGSNESVTETSSDNNRPEENSPAGVEPTSQVPSTDSSDISDTSGIDPGQGNGIPPQSGYPTPGSNDVTTSEPTNEPESSSDNSSNLDNSTREPDQGQSNAPTTTSQSVPSPPDSSGTCTGEGFFPDPKDCHKFIRCVSTGSKSFTKYSFNCGEGTAWDQNLQTCNYEYAVPECGSGNEIDSSTSKPTPEQQPTGPSSQVPENSTPETTTSVDDSSDNSPNPATTVQPAEETPSSTSAPDTEMTSTTEQTELSTSTSAPDSEMTSTTELMESSTSTLAPDSESTNTTESAEPSSPSETSTEENVGTSTESTESSSPTSETTTDGASESTTTELTPTTPSGSGESSTQEAEESSPTQESTPTTESGTTESQGGSGSTTSSPKPSPSKNSGKCEEEGFHPHPSDCRKFIRCVKVNNKFIKYDFNCGPGTAWDQSLLTCNYIEQVESCSSGGGETSGSQSPDDSNQSTTSPSPGSGDGDSENSSPTTVSGASTTESMNASPGLPSKPNKGIVCNEAGFYGNPNNCAKFYRCVDNGKGFNVYHFDCPPGTIFDPSISVCNYPESVYPARDCQGGSGAESATTPGSMSGTSSTTTQSATTEGSESTTEGGESTTEGGESTTEGGESTTEGGESTTEGGESTTEGGESTTEGGDSTTEGSESTTEGGDSTTEVGESTTEGGESTTEGSESTTEGGESTTEETTEDGASTTDGGAEATTETSTESPEETTTSEEGASTTDQSETTESAEQTTESETTTESSQTTDVESVTTADSGMVTPCPIGNLTDEQIVLVCPTGFRRHPKYCNMIYQCTNEGNMEIKILILGCPEGTIFDEQKNQCLPEAEASKKCDTTMASARFYRTLENSAVAPVRVTRDSLCPEEGHYPYQEGCSNAFYKCKRDSRNSIQGYLYKCPKDFVYWSVSRRCERKTRLPMCSQAKYNEWSHSFENREELPVEDFNVSARMLRF